MDKRSRHEDPVYRDRGSRKARAARRTAPQSTAREAFAQNAKSTRRSDKPNSQQTQCERPKPQSAKSTRPEPITRNTAAVKPRQARDKAIAGVSLAAKQRKPLRLYRALPFVGALCVPALIAGMLASPAMTTAEQQEVKQKSTLSNLMSQEQVETLSAKYKASLDEGQSIDVAAYATATDSSQLKPIATPKIDATEQTGNGILISWSKSKGAQGYTIYRSGNNKVWEKLDHVKSSARYYHDTNIKKGKLYYYALVATTKADGKCNSGNSSVKKRVYLAAPKVSVSKSGQKATVEWALAKNATSYTLQYASNSLFTGAKSVHIKDGETLNTTLKGLDKKASCYVRIRAISTKSGKEQSGCWSYSSNAKEEKTASLTKAKTSAGKHFELRSAAKQKTKDYDTLQGSCSSGSYGFYALYNQSLNKSKLVKVRLSDMKVVKVSKALSIYHANDLTYNSKEKRVVVVHNAGDGYGLSLVDPSTLKVKKTVHISRSVSGLFDAEGAGISTISGISSIGYSAKKDCYVATIGDNHNLLVLDADFNTTRVIALNSKSNGVYQNLELSSDMIIVSTSAGGGQGSNYLWCYSWEGKLVSKIRVPHSHELESVFFSGKNLYAGFYNLKEVTKTKWVTKKKKVTGKNGKVKIKKVKKKKTYTVLQRDNYCYKVSGY